MGVEGTCWPPRVTQALGYVDATFNITTDVVFAVLIPVPLFCRLNVNTRRRIYLIGVLGLGILACSACIVKTVHLYQMVSYEDFLWDSQYISMWVVAELNTGIAAGSIPAIRPWFRRLLGPTVSGQEGQNKITPFSLTTVGSQRRSWRILSAGQRPTSLQVVAEDGLLDELVETGGTGPRP